MKLFQSLHNIFPFSKQRLPFASISPQDLEFFRSFLPPHHIITDSSDLQPFNSCWRKINYGQSQLALTPSTSEQVSKILQYCNDKKLAVVPQGGNTGLVGGSVPVFDEIVLSTKNINKIEKFDPISSVISCQAGTILEKLNEYLLEYGCQIPLDLGAKGTCQIGGNAATNAGGKYVIKHGSFRSHILGMEAVLPNGQILDMRTQIHKDNTGYDLKNLLIGSEGTLGVITKLNIHCPKIDENRKILVFKTDAYSKIIKSLPVIKKQLGKQLFAMEFLDGITYQCVRKNLGYHIMDVKADQFLLFIETNLDDIENLVESLPDFIDSIMSSNDQEFQKIWKVREEVSLAAKMQGKVYSYDLSFNVGEWNNLVNDLRKEFPQYIVLGYGHIGDGNIHINICREEKISINEESIFKRVAKFKGSISAEHGLGLDKGQYLYLQKSPQILRLYKEIKKIFDPNGIMNPYKVLPE